MQTNIIRRSSSSRIDRLVFSSLCAVALSIASFWHCTAAGLTIFWPSWRSTSINQRGQLPTSGVLQLSKYDVVLIIDKSRSMSVVDCPRFVEKAESSSSALTGAAPDSMVSRWQWCQEQTLSLIEAAQSAFPLGLKMVMFSGEYVTYDNINPPDVHFAFSQNAPAGPTYATRALSSQFEEYFARRSVLGERAKPVLIAMITDGCPENPTSVCYAIADATKRMKRPDEIAITVLQIGNDPRATMFMEQLHGIRVSRNAKFKIVTTKSFEELQTIGLVRALVDAVAVKQVTEANAKNYGTAGH